MNATFDVFHTEAAIPFSWPSFPELAIWRRQKAAATDLAGGYSKQAERRCVLIVEDHDDTLRSMKLLLTRLGYKVLAAANMTQALHISEQEKFDILLSDIGLPDGTGHELLKRLRTKRQVRALALSGFGMDEDIERSREAGFADHLTKPVSIDRLQSAMQELESGGA
ncbi:MAG TPA: response regulator [Chthoniobacterales bacterium]|jgi:CheY-like chemotaxis protein|nr:response regulator [Chthoniobacterales bacterium]